MAASEQADRGPPALLRRAERPLRPATILQIVPGLSTGGAERTAVDVAAALAARGHRALVASEGGPLEDELEDAGGIVLRFPAAVKNPVRILANARRLEQLIQHEGIELVHARSRAPAWSALIAARRAGVPFVTTYHGIYRQGSVLKGLYNSVMARGDIVIANSRRTADVIRERHRVEPPRVVIIHRGMDLAAFEPDRIDPARVAELRAAWQARPDEAVILQLARLTPWKGQKVTIAAIAALVANGTTALRLVLAGDAQGRDAYAADLVAAAHEAGIADRVVLPGRVAAADVPAVMSAADIVVVASTGEEAFGRAAVEAQAAGRPVVVTDHGAAAETVAAPPEVATTLRTGWRVPPGDAAALAGALAEALALAPGERQALAARARLNARRFSLERMCESTLGVYAQLLGRPL